MSEEDLGEQAAAEGEDTLAELVTRDGKHFNANLEMMEAQTAVAWTATKRLTSMGKVLNAVAAAIRWATLLGVVEGAHLIVKNW